MPLGDVLVPSLAVGLTLLALVVALAVRRWWRSFRARRRAGHAHDGERRAGALLERAGYTIEGAQVRRRCTVSCSGKPLPIELRADYVVRRGDRRYVADVKTGALATRLETSATRRQLLEYRLAYDVSGVLLVDVDSERVHEIGFDFGPHGAKL